MDLTSKGKKKASCLSLYKMRKSQKEKNNLESRRETIRTDTSVVDKDINKCTLQFSSLNSTLTENPFAFFPNKSGMFEKKEKEIKDEDVKDEKKKLPPCIYFTNNFFSPTNIIDIHARKRTWKGVSFSDSIEYIEDGTMNDKEDSKAQKHSHKKLRTRSSNNVPSNTRNDTNVSEWKYDYDDVSYSSND